MWAQPVTVEFQSRDLTLFVSSSSKPALHSSVQTNSASTSSPVALIVGLTIGLVSLGVLSVLLGIFIYRRSKRFRRSARKPPDLNGASHYPEIAEVNGQSAFAEVDRTSSRREV